MATYISLINFTEEGAKHIKDSPSRAKAFDEAAEASGIRIAGQYWTIGGYDGVLIVSADTEQQALHWLTELVSAGNVTTETMRAFDAKEFEGIVSGG
jgi:uncharacterized protein with GYD domain